MLTWAAFPPQGLWPLVFVCQVPLLLAARRLAPGGLLRGLGIGLLTGFLAWMLTCPWFLPVLQGFADLGAGLSLLVAVLFWLLHGLQYGVFAWAWLKLTRRGMNSTLAAVTTWAALELLYPQLFPAYHAGFLHGTPHWIQIADLGGPLLVSALVIAVNGAIYELIQARRERPRRMPRTPAVVVALVLATLAYGHVRLRQVEAGEGSSGDVVVGLVQANVTPAERRDQPRETLERHRTLSQALLLEDGVDLMVWPEVSYPWTLAGTRADVRGLVTPELSVPLLFGALVVDEDEHGRRLTNSAILAGARGQVIGRYDKHEPVAFSERMPLGDRFPFLHEWFPRAGRITAGSGGEALELGDTRIAVLICLEDTLPRFVRRVVHGTDPHLLLNLTNDAWFGRTGEPFIHFALSKLRAVEHRRWLVRATNTGVTAVVDATGRTRLEVPAFESTALRARVPRLAGARTVYARLGDWPGWLSLLVVLAGLLVPRGALRRLSRRA